VGTTRGGAGRRELGQRGEAVAAAAHLRRTGLRVVARNWRCRHGELDVVARAGGELVVVEVKARSSLGQGHPAEAVTAAKADRIRRLCAAFLAAHPEHADVTAVRVDVVAVVFRRGRPALLQHLRGVA
jgi:putative endonuclease